MKGQPAPKPSSLKSPVPQKSEMQEIGEDLSATASSIADDIEWELNDDTPVAAETPAPAGPTPDQFAADSQWNNPVDIVRDNIAQLSPQNLIDRVVSGLAANDTEKMGYLEKKYGKGNVALKDDKIYFRRDASEKLRPLDPATFELVSDIIPDFMREIVTEGAMLPGELGGAAMFSPAGPAGAAGGAVMGRVASVPMANAVADAAAEQVGVPRDPSRDQGTENLIGMTAEGVMPGVGKFAAKQIAKRVPGTLAYKAAREAGERESVALAKGSEEVVDAFKRLEKEGYEVPLRQDQVHPDSPQIAAKVAEVRNAPVFQSMEMDAVNGWKAQEERILEDIKRRINPKGSIPGSKIASNIKNTVETLEKIEGEAIGEYRKKALVNLKNAKTQLPASASQLATEAMTELGFSRQTRKINSITRPGTVEGVYQRGIEPRNQITRYDFVPPKNLQAVEGRLGLTEGQTRATVNVLNEYGQLITRGNEARLTDVERIINRMGPLAQKLQGTKGGAVLGEITGELRQHRRDMIKSGLPTETDKKLFDAVMDDFSLIRKSSDDLTSVLEKDMSAKAVVNHFMSPGADRERLKSLKAIVRSDGHQYQALKEEFMNQLMLNHADNPGGLLAALKKNYDDDFLREVFDGNSTGKNLQQFKDMLVIGDRIKATTKGLSLDKTHDKQVDAATEGIVGWLYNSPYRILNGAKKYLNLDGNKENAVMELFNRDGYEKYVKGYKGQKKTDLVNKIEGLLTEYNAARAGSKKVKALTDIGKEITKRGTKATIREDVMRD